MATLRGKGSMKGVEVLVVKYPSAETKDGKRVFTDVMLHDAEGQVNPHLVSRKRDLDGRTVYDHSAGYSAGQFDAIKQAAGDNVVQMPDRNGKPGPTVYAVKTDLMKASGTQPGLVINTKTLQPSEMPKIDEKVLDGVFAQSKAASEANKARKAAEKEAQAEAAQAAPGEPTPLAADETQVKSEAEITEPEF